MSKSDPWPWSRAATVFLICGIGLFLSGIGQLALVLSSPDASLVPMRATLAGMQALCGAGMAVVVITARRRNPRR